MSDLDALERRVSELTEDLERAQDAVRRCTEANADLSHNAAEARAKNQGAGHGLLGMVLGSGYRGAVRRAAAASNADIARQVAEKRVQIADAKRAAQEEVRALKAELTQAKKDLAAAKGGGARRARGGAAADDPLDLLARLKAAHESGLLTDAEYAEKRAALLARL